MESLNNSVLTPIAQKRNYQVVCEQIVQAIKSGQFQQGTKIPAEAEMIDAFNVGRGSIREAIKSLQFQGILSSYPGRGTFVVEDALVRIHNNELLAAMQQKDSIQYMMEIRFLLEPQIAYFAAKRGSDADIEELFAIINQMVAGQSRTDIMIPGSAFHQKLADMCGNPILTKLYDAVAESVFQLRQMEFVTLEIYRRGTEEHKQIAEAVKNRDAELAKRLMHEHLVSDYPTYSGL